MDVQHGGSVVVGVDGSESALDAVRWAADEARLRGAALRLVAAVPWTTFRAIGLPQLGQEYQRQVLTTQAEEHLAAAAAHVADIPGLEVEREVRGGEAPRVIADESTRARLVVLGTRGRGGFAGLLLGSVAVSAAAHAACPVVVVRGEAAAGTAGPAPVVVGVDGSVESEAALAFAFEEAALRGAPLVGVHVWSDEVVDPFLMSLLDWAEIEADQHKELANQLTPWAGKFPGVEVRRVTVRGGAAGALVEQSAGAALLVVGSRGRGGAGGMLLGSVSQAVLRHARCPVAVTRAADEVTAP